jgi:hypothetical protein
VSRNYTISIGTSANLSISTPPNLGTIDISKGYTTTLQAVGGRPPYTWTINGTKPASVNLAANGTLTANSSTDMGVFSGFGGRGCCASRLLEPPLPEPPLPELQKPPTCAPCPSESIPAPTCFGTFGDSSAGISFGVDIGSAL